MKEAVPKLRRVAVIYNPENRGNLLALEETQRWAMALDVTLQPQSLSAAHELDGMFEQLARSRPDALMTTADVLFTSHRARIVDFAVKNRLPSIFPGKEYVSAGGFMSYGGSISDIYRHAALYVDRILKGAKPRDLHVEQPSKFEMVINLKAARALGLTVPPSLLLRADQVIE